MSTSTWYMSNNIITNRQLYTYSVLTIMRVPPSLVVSRKAEHRNSDEDGQDNIRGNNAYYWSNVYYVTGTKICETEVRLWQQNQNPHTIIIPASQSSNMLRRVTYLAVLLQTLKDKEFVKHQIKKTSQQQSFTVKTHTGDTTHQTTNPQYKERQTSSWCVFFWEEGKGGNQKERSRATCPSALFQMAVLSYP